MDKDLGKLIEQKLRATPSREFQASPILNEHQWEIDRLLRLHIDNEWFLFVGTGLSAFFNPTLYFGHSDDEADLILKSSALFCIATPPPDSELRLMVIEQGNPGLEKFLTKHGVQWIYYSGLIPAIEFARQIDVILAKSPTKKHNQRNSINEAEHRVQHALRMVGKYELERSGNLYILVDRGHLRDEAHQLLSHSSYRLLHEVALHRLRPKQPLVLSPEVEWISRTSSVDLLLHSRGDESVPLIAVEVDGPHHLEEKQIAKDRAKDEFLNAIGLPILRISHIDASFWQYPKSLPWSERQRIRSFVNLISDAVLTIAGCLAISRYLRADVDSAQSAIAQAEDKLSKAMWTSPASIDISQLPVDFPRSSRQFGPMRPAGKIRANSATRSIPIAEWSCKSASLLALGQSDSHQSA